MKKLSIAKSNLAIAYFGTPYFSAIFLDKILNDSSLPIEVKLIITRPDKPVGRKQEIISSPVKQIANKYKIEVFEIENLKNENSMKIENLKLKIKACDFAFLFAYGGIIPKDLLNQPRFGFLNIHPSLLPKYRGPSPISYPLIFGDEKTGVTLIKLDEGIDHGPILMQEILPILPHESRPDLEIKLTNLAFQMFLKLVNSLTRESSNKLIFTQQDHKRATFTRMLEKKDGFISFSTLQKVLKNEPLSQNELPDLIKNSKLKIRNSSKIIYNYFRGLYPWPGLWTIIQPDRLPLGRPKRLKITDIDFSNNKLVIKKVQLEGKNEVDFKTFQSAYRIFTP